MSKEFDDNMIPYSHEIFFSDKIAEILSLLSLKMKPEKIIKMVGISKDDFLKWVDALKEIKLIKQEGKEGEYSIDRKKMGMLWFSIITDLFSDYVDCFSEDPDDEGLMLESERIAEDLAKNKIFVDALINFMADYPGESLNDIFSYRFFEGMDIMFKTFKLDNETPGILRKPEMAKVLKKLEKMYDLTFFMYYTSGNRLIDSFEKAGL